MLPVPTLAELSAFSGRPEQLYPAYNVEALKQATLLFSVVTGLQEFPESADQAQLARYAILEMADQMILEQPQQALLASPFQSETVGSYTYAKSAAATKARTGVSTGMFWWDLAVDQLAVASSSPVLSGSIGGFEAELGYNSELDRQGIRGPADDIDPPYVRIS